MTKKLLYFLFFSFPSLAQPLDIGLLEAKENSAISMNEQLWQAELEQISPNSSRFFFVETDLSNLGKHDIITLLYNDKVCGMDLCPLKIFSDGKEIFSSYVPLRKYPLKITIQTRGFYPSFFINEYKFTYHYDIERYKAQPYSHQFSSPREKCLKCSRDVPKNPTNSPIFSRFAADIQYEAESAQSSTKIGLYGLSKAALSKINLVDSTSILSDDQEFLWTSKANQLGIKNNSDFLKSHTLQEKIFKEYINYLSRNLSLELLCTPVIDEYNRNGFIDYWSILKKSYMLGVNSLEIPTFDGNSKNKYYLDGNSLKNKCIKKVITSFIFN